MNSTPATIGTDVRLTIFSGSSLVAPETMMITAATGETARKRLPASPRGTAIATGEIPDAVDNGTKSGIIA